MNTNERRAFPWWVVLGGLAFTGGMAPTAEAQPQPYAVDADTLHLWHFDEMQNDGTLPEFYTLEEVNGDFWNLAVTNGAKLAGPAFSAELGGSLDTHGIVGTGESAGAYAEKNFYILDFELTGNDGAFTYEALVHPDFDPATAAPDRTTAMEIISFDSDAATIAERYFLFRLTPPVSNEQWALEFTNISSAQPGTNVLSFLDLVEDFSGDLSAYTETRVLDQGAAENVDFAISNGVLQTTSTGDTGAEQTVLLRDDVSLGVNMEMQVDVITNSLANSQDIGLMVAATASQTPLVYNTGAGGTQSTREDHVTVYVRGNAEVYSRGHNGTTELPLAGGPTGGAVVERLFIARTASNTFETGWYDAASNRTVLATRTVDNTDIGSAIGFYSDQRADGTVSGLDNLTRYTIELSVPPAETEVFSAPLPTNGVDAAAAGNWYHVAATYNGSAGAADNLTLYWTELSHGPSQASVLGSFAMSNDLGSAASPTTTLFGNFAVGNENRGVQAENFIGYIDEVRVSSIARSASAFNLGGTPYSADDSTLLLLHFDEANPTNFPASVLNDAMDEVIGDPQPLDVRNGASFGATAFSGFGTAMLVNGGGNDAAGAYADPGLGRTQFVDAATGAFTFEALVRPDFDPAGTNEYMQIVSMEGDGGDRPFQWRFVQRTNAAPLQVEFIKISGGEQHLVADVPSSGPHAASQGNWYHAAVTYNGDPADTNNFTFYWTALDSGITVANPILVTNLATDLAGATGDFAVGNEDRATGGNTDALVGAIDEVRISSVARAADRFLFSDLSFVIPEIQSIGITGGGTTVDLSWTSDAGHTYTIRRSTDLETGEDGWTPVKTGIAGGDPTTSDSVASGGVAAEAYRVEVE